MVAPTKKALREGTDCSMCSYPATLHPFFFPARNIRDNDDVGQKVGVTYETQIPLFRPK